MSGIVINIDPVIGQIGPFQLGWYSVAILLAVMVAVLIAAGEAKRKGIPSAEIYGLLPWVLLAGLVGARLFHVIDRWEYYAGNPLQILQLQQGGLAIWGALAGGAAATVVYARVRHISLGRLADVAAPAILAGQIIGRLGCIINGDAAGGVTSLPWGFVYVHPQSMIAGGLYGVPTHPYPVYEMLWNGAVLLFIMRLRHRLAKDGLLFLSYLSLYSVGRFVLSFVRQENAMLWGLQQSQVLAIAMLMASVAVFIYLWQTARAEVTSESTS